jgi:putative flippase GtrA
MTRFVRFNIVGLLGFGVQLAVLVSLQRAGWPVLLAAVVAVEAAVLHNFVWHERWTWAGVRVGSCAGRLARFHAVNGLISLSGNAIITVALADAGVSVALANICAVVACAAANYMAAHLLVFCATTWPSFDGHLH